MDMKASEVCRQPVHLTVKFELWCTVLLSAGLAGGSVWA